MGKYDQVSKLFLIVISQLVNFVAKILLYRNILPTKLGTLGGGLGVIAKNRAYFFCRQIKIKPLAIQNHVNLYIK